MTESDFLALADTTLDAIEAAVERAAEEADVDVECSRSGNVLEIELVDTGVKVIVNSQAPMKEMWVAAKSGGFHYRNQAGQWIDTRSGAEMYSALSEILTQQSGKRMLLGTR